MTFRMNLIATAWTPLWVGAVKWIILHLILRITGNGFQRFCLSKSASGLYSWVVCSFQNSVKHGQYMIRDEIELVWGENSTV